MSNVEIFWKQVSSKFGDGRAWHQLDPMQQMQVIQGINMILSVVKAN
jgi:hypothetical protein